MGAVVWSNDRKCQIGQKVNLRSKKQINMKALRDGGTMADVDTKAYAEKKPSRKHEYIQKANLHVGNDIFLGKAT